MNRRAAKSVPCRQLRVAARAATARPRRGAVLVGLFVFAAFAPWSDYAARIERRSKVPVRRARLLAWYDVHRRVLPWRAQKGERADPYRVWLCEIMLQQTTVQAVAGYYRKFLARWPDVKALAEAPLDDVLAAWAGLGYYARARNLHTAAKIVAGELGGKFPDDAEGLRALPGIGAYTAGAIAAIAYDCPQAAMDANAERVIARLFAVKSRCRRRKSELHARSASRWCRRSAPGISRRR